MSTYANADKAHVWVDGDIFRAPSGTALPANIFASSLSGWDAYGGIKAGFVVTPTEDVTDVDVWNNETDAPYKRIKKSGKVSIKFRAVDYSVATTLTLLRGGSVSAAAGGFELIKGDEEAFALVLRVYDGADKKAYYCNTGEIIAVPEENLGADDDVEGFDFEYGPLPPSDASDAMRVFLTSNPLV